MKMFSNWIVAYLFGCRHHHMSRVFTIKHRTYRVCFDCGDEFDYLLEPDAKRATLTPQFTG